MRYNELRIKADRIVLETLEAELIAAGFTGMQIDDPEDELDILAHPDVYRYDYINEKIGSDTDRQPEITLYFEDNEEGAREMDRAAEVILQLDEGKAGSGDAGHISISTVPAGDDSEWLYKWQEHFKPTRVGGGRIVVRPSWEEYEPEEGDLVIEMDPGMAFGSGLHETTSMCIRALEKYMPEMRHNSAAASGPGTARVMDVGCGTGILAIAAALLGADECLGIDIDPEAVRVAGENIHKNGLSDRIEARLGDLTEGVEYEADIIAANLMADLVMRLSPAAAEHLRQGGLYITSGILDIKEDIVRQAVEAAGFDIMEMLSDGEWRAIVARKS